MHNNLTTLPDLLLDLTVSLRQSADKAERAALALARPIPNVTDNGKHGLEVDRHALTVRWNGDACFLGYTLAFRLIDRLAQRPDHYFSYAHLLDDVWGGPRSPSAIRNVVSDLRGRLAGAGMADLASVNQRWGEKNRREHVRRALKRWYRRRATAVLKCEAEAYSKRIGLGPNEIRLKQMRQRWASCTPDSTLYFDWRIIMASRRLAQCVVAHEVCHLIHPTHGKDFWNLLEKVMPDYRERQSALERIGSRLTL